MPASVKNGITPFNLQESVMVGKPSSELKALVEQCDGTIPG